jgi:hypothetical protein
MKISKQNLTTLLFIGGFGVHIFAEFVRRFILFSNSVYLLADIMLLVFVVLIVKFGRMRFDMTLGSLLLLYVVWGLVSMIASDENPILIGIGLRPIILGIASYIIAENFFRSRANAPDVLLLTTKIFTVVVFAVAVIQILSGETAEINILPSLEAEMAGGGRGQYMAGLSSLEGIFRPTSIFMHTGRFGQYSFFVSLILCTALVLRRDWSKGNLMFAILSIFSVIISGQRAAGVFLIICIAGSLLLFGSKSIVNKLLVGFVAFFILLITLGRDIFDLVIGRFASGFSDGFERVAEMGRTWEVGFSLFPIFGKGLGFFSFGGLPYGGAIYYDYMAIFGGGGENAWLRVQGETGVLGMIIFFLSMFFISMKTFRRAMSSDAKTRFIHFSAYCFCSVSIFWALTHDVYGNYLYFIGIFLLFGASSGCAFQMQSKPSQIK